MRLDQSCKKHARWSGAALAYKLNKSSDNPNFRSRIGANHKRKPDQIAPGCKGSLRYLPEVNARGWRHLGCSARREVYKDGALSGKIKRLMALSGALVHGCRACIIFQTEHALNLGASVEEVLEACSVAISLGGTMAAGETTRVFQYLQEKGLIENG